MERKACSVTCNLLSISMQEIILWDFLVHTPSICHLLWLSCRTWYWVRESLIYILTMSCLSGYLFHRKVSNSLLINALSRQSFKFNWIDTKDCISYTIIVRWNFYSGPVSVLVFHFLLGELSVLVLLLSLILHVVQCIKLPFRFMKRKLMSVTIS